MGVGDPPFGRLVGITPYQIAPAVFTTQTLLLKSVATLEGVPILETPAKAVHVLALPRAPLPALVPN